MPAFKNPFAKDDSDDAFAPSNSEGSLSAGGQAPEAAAPAPPPPGFGAGVRDFTTSAAPAAPVPAPPLTSASKIGDEGLVDLPHRREQLRARVAELTFDLGGLVYEMAIRDRIRVDILVRRAAILQQADAELNEVERILRVEETSTAGLCSHCGSPHSSGAAFCWQCGQPLLEQVPATAVAQHG